MVAAFRTRNLFVETAKKAAELIRLLTKAIGRRICKIEKDCVQERFIFWNDCSTMSLKFYHAATTCEVKK